MLTQLSHRIAVAVGLSNLWLFFVWTGLLSYTPQNEFLMRRPPQPVLYWATLGCLIALSLAWVGLLTLIERAEGPWKRTAQVAFLLALAVPLNSIRDVIAISTPMLRGQLLRVYPMWMVLTGVGLLAAAALLVILWKTAQVYRIATILLMLASPSALVSSAHAVYLAVVPRAERPTPVRVSNEPRQTPHRRVVWVIFDELDGRLLTDWKPASLPTPAFDRLRRESISATDAHSPATFTLKAIPSLLIGREVETEIDDAALRLHYPGESRTFRLRDSQNVLSDGEPFGAGVAGWFIPYCRIFGSRTSACAWEQMPFKVLSLGDNPGEIAVSEIRSIFETSLFSPFGQSLVSREGARSFARLKKEAFRMALNPELGFCFLHLQPPHAPHFYNRQTGLWNRANAPIEGYWDGVALADATLAELRDEMTKAGVWDTTDLIITSDHPYRTGERLVGRRGDLVPYIVHIGGESTGIPVRTRFETVRTRSLVRGLLTGQLRSAAEAAAWMSSSGAPAKP